MSKLWDYAMPKYEFRFWPCMGPKQIFSRGVDLIYSGRLKYNLFFKKV